MPEQLGIGRQLTNLLQRIGSGGEGGGSPEHSGALAHPETVRDPSMAAEASTAIDSATTVPFSAPGDLSRVVAKVKELLSTSAFDWAVTRKDAEKAIIELGSLTPSDRARAVEELGPSRLTTIEAKLAGPVRERYAGVIAAIRTARNAPAGAPEADAFLADAQGTLRGLLATTYVNQADARRIIDGLRRFSPQKQDQLLDDLGPGKTQWLTSALSSMDKEIYAPTIERCRTAHFGAVARADAKRGLSPRDVSARFMEILDKVERGEMKLDPAKHGGVTYLFVRGLVTEHQPGYFERNMNRLKERGLTVKLSGIDTDADIETNAKKIREEIRDLSGGAEDKVFIVSHSKGGPDVRRAMQDEATDRSAFFWNAMQSACGTPVASTLMEGFMGEIIERTLKSLFGAPNGNALKDLDYKTQKKLWIDARAIDTPILSLATTVGRHPSALRETDGLMHQRYQLETDGLVPKSEQLVGGTHAYAVVMDGVDHAAPAARPLAGPLAPKHDPADLQEAQILLAYELREAMR